MKTIYLSLIALSLVACSGNGGKQKQANGNDSTVVSSKPTKADEAAKARKAAEKIYADVFGWYNKAEQAGTEPQEEPDFNAYYTSNSYKALLQKVVDKDRSLIAKGEVGFFDYDHWICGQDYQGLAFAVAKCERISDERCRVEADITNCGQKQRITLMMVFEDGVWRIDDFIRDGSSEKTSMAQYVKK